MLRSFFKISALNATLLFSVISMTGCTTYPKQYTYSPSITINGSSTVPVELPNPFSKTPHKKTERVYTYNHNGSESLSCVGSHTNCTMEPDLPYGFLYGNNGVETIVFAN